MGYLHCDRLCYDPADDMEMVVEDMSGDPSSPRGFAGRSHKITDLALEYRHETGLAYLVSDDGKRECWLPKSLVEYDGRNIFTMPEWLAKREGLI